MRADKLRQELLLATLGVKREHFVARARSVVWLSGGECEKHCRFSFYS